MTDNQKNNETNALPVTIEPVYETPPARYDTADTLWQAPAPTVGMRKISDPSRGSGRAILVGGKGNREIHCESLLEASVAMFMLTHPLVADIREQQGPVIYIDSKGKQRQHYFDFVVTMKDGRRIAIAVRPKALMHRLSNEFDNIIRGAGGFADGFLIIHDEMIPPWQIINAALVLSARREPNPAHDAIIEKLVSTLHGQIQIADLVDASGLTGDGFRAVVRLIDAGKLELVTNGVINYEARVQHVGITIEGDLA